MKHLTLLTLVAVALTGCDNDNIVPIPVRSEILFGAQAFVTTKTPFEGKIANDNKFVAHIVGTETSNKYQTPYKDSFNKEAKGDITFADQGVTLSGFPSPVNWPASDTKVLHFRGFYPGSAWTIEENTAVATIDGKSDLMGTTEVSGSKKSVSAQPLRFGFTHILTKLHLRVVGSASSAATWGNITNIELSKASNAEPSETATLTYSSGTATFSSSVDAAIPFFKASESADSKITYTDDALSPIAVTATPTLVAYSLVPPVDAKAGDGDDMKEYTIKITTSAGEGTSGKEVGINLKGTDGNDLVGTTDGKMFDITISFGRDGEITTTATVNKWVEGGSSGGDI